MNDETAGRPIRVLIADDHAIVRKGIRALLTTEKGIEVAGEATNGREAVEQERMLHPDVILMDLMMPEMDGIEAIQLILAHRPEACILVLTSFSDDDKVFPAITAGAQGYLLKDSGPKELVAAIGRVYRGESSLHPKITRKVLAELSHASEEETVDSPLTDREMEVLLFVARGWNNQQIAVELSISEATVRTHVSNILGKLELSSRTQAALYALKEGLASLDQIDQDD
jgi:NarL family two-component system response regulator LiaR